VTTTWPFGTDADQHDPLTAHRIAVTSPYASWCYIVAFDRDSPSRPTDQETATLASFLDEYKSHWYGIDGAYLKKLHEKPLDVDGGANGITFRKYGPDDWGYRRRTWDRGPTFVPAGPAFVERGMGPLDLVQLMDHIHAFDGIPSKRWTDWKTAHPGVFPA
jgi:hypothetical protein